MSLPPELLSSALNALEEATRGYAPQNEQVKLATWREQAGMEKHGVEIGLYCLHRSTSLRTRFFAAKQLEQSLPNCLTRGLLSLEHVWEVRTQLLHYAITLNPSADSRALTSALAAALATVTVAGFALRPAEASESSHAGSQPPGFSNAQRHEVLAQIEGLLKPPTDASAQTTCALGLNVVTELIDRFDDRNALGGIKRSSAVNSLSWAERRTAKQVFAEGVLPALTSMLMHLLDALLARVRDARKCIEKAVSALSAALDFHLEEGTVEAVASHLPSLHLPGVYIAHSPSSNEEEEGRPLVSARYINAAMAAMVLQAPVPELLMRLLAALKGDFGAANGTPSDEIADEDDAAINSCHDCLISLAAFASTSVDWAATLIGFLLLYKDEAQHPAELYYIARSLRILLTTVSPITVVGNAQMVDAALHVLPSIAFKAARCSTTLSVGSDRGIEAEQTAMSVFDEICFTLLDLHRNIEHRSLSEGLKQAAGSVFSAFLDIKLQAAAHSGLSNVTDEEVEQNMKDKDLSYQTLTAIAALGRLSPSTALAHIDRQLQYLTSRSLNLIHRDAHPNDSAEDLARREYELTACHEQVHWVLLLAGFLLADEGIGETPSVPIELLQLSRSQLRPDDHVLSISENVLHLLRSTSLDPASAAAARCSPQVGEDLIWFIGRWSLSYLLTDASNTGPLSPNLITAFNGEGGLHVLHEILQCFAKAIKQFSADEDSLIELGTALSAMSRSRALCTCMARLRSFAEFVESVLTEESVFSNKATASLWKGIVRCVANCYELSEGRVLLEEVILVTQRRMQHVLDSSQYRVDQRSPPVISKLLGVLDIYHALISSAQSSIIEPWLEAVSAFCPVLSTFLEVYMDCDDVLTSTIECFSGVARALSNGFIVDTTESKVASLINTLHQAILVIVKMISRPGTSTEMQRETLMRLLEIVSLLLSAAEGSDESLRPAALAVVEPAFSTVAALVTNDSLSFPDFLSSWVKLLRSLSRTALQQMDAAAVGSHGDKVTQAVETGLTVALRSINEDDVVTAIEAAEALALASLQHGASHLSHVLDTLLRVALETLCFEPCSATLFCDHLLIVQLILLGFSRTNDAHLRQLLDAFVSANSRRAPSLSAAVSKIAITLTRNDALVVTPGRRGRLKPAISAQDEALACLRDLRLEVRM